MDTAIALFSGVTADKAREIWLVDRAPVVIEKLREATESLQRFMESQGLSAAPDEVANLKGDAARVAFVEKFKQVQKLQTQLDQYTDLSTEQKAEIATILPKDELTAFRGQYLETAQRLRAQQVTPGSEPNKSVDQIDFEFVLFASATIDYDYIMQLITDYSARTPGKTTMSREQLIGLIAADSKFMDEREDITEYVQSLTAGQGLDEAAIRAGYERFKTVKAARELAEIADRHGLAAEVLQKFVDGILSRRIFDGEQLTELLAPMELGWKVRAQKEVALMRELVPVLKKRSGGREISGLRAYEE